MDTVGVDFERYELWVFLTSRGADALSRWAEDERLSKGDRARLNQKIDRLAQMDFKLAIGTKLLNGPIRKEIYKLIVHGQVMMRPLLCRGPFQKSVEYTFLAGAIERDWKLKPPTCFDDATNNRNTILRDSTRRCRYEPLPA